jgi:large subunit ribosomal protein L13
MANRQSTTWLTKEAAQKQREWYVIDLDGVVLGRAATRIASVLRGKHKPNFTPNTDCGDFVIVLNAGKAKLTGLKMKQKMYRHHTGYIGSLKEATAEKTLAEKPEIAIRNAVWGMLPKGALGRQQIKKLRIYSGSEHDHVAQKPRELAL